MIGVTGHRDLRPSEVERLEHMLDVFMRELRADHPHTPLLLLSPVAEGADRLTARVALRRGLSLIVPLPMAPEEYERDFDTEESRQEFEGLLEQASYWFSLSDERAQGEARERQYEAVGAYVARHSQILVALWDGKDLDRIGGTSAIVRSHLSGVSPRAGPLDEVDSGPVYQIVTSRRDGPDVAESFQEFTWYPGTGDGTGAARYSGRPTVGHTGRLPFIRQGGRSGASLARLRYWRIRDRIDRFNQDALRLGMGNRAEIQETKAAILGQRHDDICGDLERLGEAFALADALALRFQRRTTRMLMWLFGLASLAALAIIVYADVIGAAAILWLYPVFFVLASVVWLIGVKWHDVQNKYQDYRALAEGLRVQLFWHMAGWTQEAAADHYLLRQKSELDWIRHAMRSLDVPLDVPCDRHGAAALDPESLRAIRDTWLRDQLRYFEARALRDLSRRRRFRLVAIALTVLGVLAALALAVAAVFLSGSVDLKPVLLPLAILLVVAAGLLEGYADKAAFAEQAKQYQRMARLFDRATRMLDADLKEERLERAAELLRALGQEALNENADWVMLHRERPLEVIKGA